MSINETAIERILNNETIYEIDIKHLLEDYVIEEEDCDVHRWVTGVSSIVEVNGRYFNIFWYRGNTEYQENEYPAQVAEEVEPFEEYVLVKSWRTKNNEQ